MFTNVVGVSSQSSEISSYNFDIDESHNHHFQLSSKKNTNFDAVKRSWKRNEQKSVGRSQSLGKATSNNDKTSGSWLDSIGCSGSKWKRREVVLKVIAELAEMMANKDGEIETLRERAAEQDKIIRELRSILPSFLQLRYYFMALVKQLLTQNLSGEAMDVLRRQLSIFRNQEKNESFQKLFSKELLKWSYYNIFPSRTADNEAQKNLNGKSSVIANMRCSKQQMFGLEPVHSLFTDSATEPQSVISCTNNSKNSSNFLRMVSDPGTEESVKNSSCQDLHLTKKSHLNERVVDRFADSAPSNFQTSGFLPIFVQDRPTASAVAMNSNIHVDTNCLPPESTSSIKDLAGENDFIYLDEEICDEIPIEEPLLSSTNFRKRSSAVIENLPVKYRKPVDDDVIVLSSDEGSSVSFSLQFQDCYCLCACVQSHVLPGCDAVEMIATYFFLAL
uniref:PCM1_C domain-containing protein n=1 Tax=Syphacia muris TaxID=451379 RepID=A0A0N5AAZ9_9BILA